MADQGLRPALLAVALSAIACGEAAPPVETANVARLAPAPAPPWPENDAAWAPYHSRRLALSIPLPSPSTWVVDDASRRELVAMQESTRSTLTVSLESGTDLVNHAKCEARAVERGLAPQKLGSMRSIEDVVTVGPEAFDTRIRVVVEPPSRPDGPILGHVFAFGAYVRKCLVIHVATSVPTSDAETVLSDRLVMARLRIVGGLRLDELGAVPREKPEVR